MCDDKWLRHALTIDIARRKTRAYWQEHRQQPDEWMQTDVLKALALRDSQARWMPDLQDIQCLLSFAKMEFKGLSSEEEGAVLLALVEGTKWYGNLAKAREYQEKARRLNL